MSTLVVADTGPLIMLIQLQQLEILEALFPHFVLPDIVFEELTRYQPIQTFPSELARLKKRSKKPTKVLTPDQDLDEGELACILLYYELNADAILIEDRVARAWAESKGILCFGSIGYLSKASILA